MLLPPCARTMPQTDTAPECVGRSTRSVPSRGSRSGCRHGVRWLASARAAGGAAARRCRGVPNSRCACAISRLSRARTASVEFRSVVDRRCPRADRRDSACRSPRSVSVGCCAPWGCHRSALWLAWRPPRRGRAVEGHEFPAIAARPRPGATVCSLTRSVRSDCPPAPPSPVGRPRGERPPPVQPEHDLRGHRAGGAAVLLFTGTLTGARHRLLPPLMTTPRAVSSSSTATPAPLQRSESVAPLTVAPAVRLPACSPSPRRLGLEELKHDRVGRAGVTGPDASTSRALRPATPALVRPSSSPRLRSPASVLSSTQRSVVFRLILGCAGAARRSHDGEPGSRRLAASDRAGSASQLSTRASSR